ADPFDLDRVKARFNKHLETIENMLNQANEHRVDSEETVQQAVAMAGDSKRLGKDLEAKRKEIVKAPNQYVRSVNAFVKNFTRPLNKIEAVLKTKIAHYQYQLELERREQERKAKEEAARLQVQLKKEAQEKGVEPAKVVPIAVPEADKVVRSGAGASAHTRRVWKAEIVDPDAVPREFCSPDIKKINEAVKAGIREMAGVRIWEDVQTILRT
ncbi:MAG: hypothetical protein JRI80_04770, partial [Deltaproteobacteria bacterium]|nr:hypothetical protein [Deltaproteobacteria bacterium]